MHAAQGCSACLPWAARGWAGAGAAIPAALHRHLQLCLAAMLAAAQCPPPMSLPHMLCRSKRWGVMPRWTGSPWDPSHTQKKRLLQALPSKRQRPQRQHTGQLALQALPSPHARSRRRHSSMSQPSSREKSSRASSGRQQRCHQGAVGPAAARCSLMKLRLQRASWGGSLAAKSCRSYGSSLGQRRRAAGAPLMPAPVPD